MIVGHCHVVTLGAEVFLPELFNHIEYWPEFFARGSWPVLIASGLVVVLMALK